MPRSNVHLYLPLEMTVSLESLQNILLYNYDHYRLFMQISMEIFKESDYYRPNKSHIIDVVSNAIESLLCQYNYKYNVALF